MGMCWLTITRGPSWLIAYDKTGRMRGAKERLEPDVGFKETETSYRMAVHCLFFARFALSVDTGGIIHRLTSPVEPSWHRPLLMAISG